MPESPQLQLVRRSVPNDNSCLFYALAYLCNANSDTASATSSQTQQHLRAVCAESALQDPDPETRALFLGHSSVALYGEWIQNPHHWGGEQEIIVLAAHFHVQVVVVSCESLTTLCYGEANNKKVYILYTGQHYDPLVGVCAEGAATPTNDQVRQFPVGNDQALESSALQVAKEHNQDAARKAKQKRVQRIQCGGCGMLLEDAPAFQTHCMEVEHDEDFAFECETVQVVMEEGEDLPEGAIDLTDETKHYVYYNADPQSPFSSHYVGEPFEVNGNRYPTVEHHWQSLRYQTTNPELAAKIRACETPQSAVLLSHREGMNQERKDWDDVKFDLFVTGLRAKYSSTDTTLLKETAPKTMVCVDVDPWKGMTAAGGIATGQNYFGKAFEMVRDELFASSS